MSMSASDGENPPPWPEGLVEAAAYHDEREAFDHGLVLLAMGVPYWLFHYAGNFRLLVEAGNLDELRHQLAAYDRESRHWPPPALVETGAKREPVLVLPLCWVLVTIAAFRAQELSGNELEHQGALDAQAVFQHGEFWRVATALFLHADIAHLTANLISGFFAFSAVFTTLGRTRGLTLLALASLAGNFAVVALHASSDYRSLGASTAIFAALGLLTGSAFRAAILATGRWRAAFVPLAAGAVLLGLFGAGGLHTDVAAHACGFVAGVIFGTVSARRESDRADRIGGGE